MLRNTKGNDSPINIVFFDTETSQEIIDENTTRHTLKLGYAIHAVTKRGKILKQNSHCIFYGSKTFWDFVISKSYSKTKLLIVSHNVNFDLSILDGFWELQKRGYKLQSLYAKGLVSIINWLKWKRKIVCIDNSNFFQGTLKKLSELVELPKLDIDFDNTDIESLLTYCKRDVEIILHLWRKWIKFIADNNGGNFKYTTSSQALEFFRHGFMSEQIHIHDNEQAIKLERDSYHGGRVECLYQGYKADDTFYSLDINSMYPKWCAIKKFL